MDILDLKEQRKEEEKIANIPVLNQAPYSFTKGVSYFWDTFKILIIAQGKENVAIADELAKNIRYPVINLAGELTLSRLAAALKRCAILISNDSGPVHIASAVGTPVISIFGRNQAGLSPLRWGPVGRQDKYLHKEVGCSVCLAHKCEISFDCLKAITVEDVLKSVDDVLKV